MLNIRPRLGLDCGSYRLRLHRAGKPAIEDHPNVAALSRRRGSDRGQNVLALGAYALEASREMPPEELELVWPVAGMIHDYIACEASLHYYGRLTGMSLLKPIVIASIAAGSSEVAKRAMYDCALAGLGAHRVYLIEDLLAVAAGVGVAETEKPRLLLQIGAGATTIGVVVDGGLAHVRMLPLAGNSLDIAIHRRLWERLDRRVDLLTCRELKHAVGTLAGARPPADPGNSLRDCEGAELDLDQAAPVVNEALEHGLTALWEEIHWFLRELPDDVRRPAERHPVLLSGGTARLPGLDAWLTERLETDIACHPRPDRAVLEGIQQILPQLAKFRFLRSDPDYRRAR